MSQVVGLSLVGLGLWRSGPTGLAVAAMGGLLAWHGANKHSSLYRALGLNSDDATINSHPFSRSVHSRKMITINRSAEELYDIWRDLSGLTRFFPHVHSIEELSDGLSRWTAQLPTGQIMTWDAIITEDSENRSISWVSVAGSDYEHRGTASFTEAAGGRGTIVTLEVRSHLPAGAIGAAFAKLIGSDPQMESSIALSRLKQWVETGEFADSTSPTARKKGWTSGSAHEAMFGSADEREERYTSPRKMDTPEVTHQMAGGTR